MQWEKRPDYEHHLGDPTQLFYDRGHGIMTRSTIQIPIRPEKGGVESPILYKETIKKYKIRLEPDWI